MSILNNKKSQSEEICGNGKRKCARTSNIISLCMLMKLWKQQYNIETHARPLVCLYSFHNEMGRLWKKTTHLGPKSGGETSLNITPYFNSIFDCTRC